MIIPQDNILKCIPIKWCFQYLVADTLNHGLNRYMRHRMFYSSDASKEANFLLPIRNTFSEAQDACYLVRIKKCFDTRNECESWLQHQRSIAVAIYNPILAAASAESHIAGEKQVQEAAERAIEIKFEVKKEVALRAEPLRKVVKRLNDLLPAVHDLTESETEEYQNALEISDDEMDTFESGTLPQMQIEPGTSNRAPLKPIAKKEQKTDADEELDDVVSGNLEFRMDEVIAKRCFQAFFL